MSWGKLLCVDIAWNRSGEDVLKAMSLCTSATFMTLRKAIQINDPGLLPDQVPLPELRTLHFGPTGTDVFRVIASLDCPNIRILHIGQWKHDIRMVKLGIAGEWTEDNLIRILDACRTAKISSVQVHIDLDTMESISIDGIRRKLKGANIDICSDDNLVTMSWVDDAFYPSVLQYLENSYFLAGCVNPCLPFPRTPEAIEKIQSSGLSHLL
ncbi:hypothetical protein P691DRAFT_787670 [Macrolepiota fuliginosa MF-IS2]|uniref:Uncharacterized protein n=1 Tax=Macrolepiota fuliginosa MF-IS2 TaxID=1400762 RepID=A0A9P6BX53_9AGAR|nr:hypothetical protein P691DRAFT_787670 [Macrolepiota fuliginosa MF-IS2]